MCRSENLKGLKVHCYINYCHQCMIVVSPKIENEEGCSIDPGGTPFGIVSGGDVVSSVRVLSAN